MDPTPHSPVVTYIDSVKLWVLERDYTYAHRDFRLTIKAGFKSDLASIPRVLWSFVAPLELSLTAALVHDFLYGCGGEPPAGTVDPPRNFSREDVDALFLGIMERERIDTWRLTAAYDAVRAFGECTWGYDRP